MENINNNKINPISPNPATQPQAKKTILKRSINGIVSGWNMPILPDNIAKFDSNIYVKIFKAIGALSTFFILSGLGLRSYPIYFYLGIALSLPYVIYRIVLVFFIIKQYISNIKKGKHIVRNSPLDKFQTFFKLSINSFKTISSATVGTGFTVALMYELDDILAEEGKSRYFIPAIKKTLRDLQLNDSIDKALKRIGIEELDLNRESIKKLDLTQLNEAAKKEFEKETGMNVVEAQKIFNYVTENRKKLEIKSEIDQLIKNDPFSTKNN
jgi:hypothetical protein